MYNWSLDVLNSQRTMLDSSGNKRGEALFNIVFFAINPVLYFGSQVHDIIEIEAIEAYQLTKIVCMLLPEITLLTRGTGSVPNPGSIHIVSL